MPDAALAEPAQTYTVLTVDVGAHSPSPVQKSGVYDQTNSALTSTPAPDGVLTMRAETGGSYVEVTVAPPTGQDWVEGDRYAANQTGDATNARLDVTSDGRSCQPGAGSLQVDQVDQTSDGSVTRFAAYYQFTCAGDFGLMGGEIRWQSTLGYEVALPEPAAVDFGRQEAGADSAARTVTFRSLGSEPISFGRATIGEPLRAAFSVTSSTCDGQTITPGETCTVSVVAHPTKAERQLAPLMLGTNRGLQYVRLSVDGFVGGVSGTYYPVAPARLMDTREGLGAPKAKLGPGQKVDLQVTGRGGVPASGVGSAVLNVTVTGPTAAGFLTVYPAGEARPNASSINFTAGWLGSNNVTVKLGAGGKVSVFNLAGNVDVVVDLVGFYASDNTLASWGKGGQYQWYEPFRLFDSRKDPRGALPAGYALNGWVDFKGYNPHVKALVLNITAVSPVKAGFLTAWSGQGTKPVASTVNYGAGKVVPNLAYVQTVPCPSGSCGGATGAPTYKIYTSATTHVVVDLVGVIDDGTVADGLRFKPSSPTRLVDSRIGTGLPTALGPNQTGRVTAWSSMVTTATQVLAMNVTAVTPSSNTVITVWPADAGTAKPTASNLNPAAGQLVSNGVLGVIGPQDSFHLHNLSGTTHLVADVVGTFYLYPGTASTTGAGALAAGSSRPKAAASGASDYVRG
ncbi:hypothetical protein [Micromonospora sp. NPDC051006]|uniref:hypothetical protein n=1 Tax=Micromonospora sp. NPDC051006 TaxID=3364283 RepID=UPI0037A1EC9B